MRRRQFPDKPDSLVANFSSMEWMKNWQGLQM